VLNCASGKGLLLLVWGLGCVSVMLGSAWWKAIEMEVMVEQRSALTVSCLSRMSYLQVFVTIRRWARDVDSRLGSIQPIPLPLEISRIP
jgi:hypothetical protein